MGVDNVRDIFYDRNVCTKQATFESEARVI